MMQFTECIVCNTIFKLDFLCFFFVENLSEQLMYILFWGSASALSLSSIYYYGNVFVNRPKLIADKLKTE